MEKTSNMPQVTEKTLSHNAVSSIPRSERESNSQRGERRTLPLIIVLLKICQFQ
jgi:hypothetical protein